MCLRWVVPICPRAEGGTDKHPWCSTGHPGSPFLEPWRPVSLLLPLVDGASRGRAAAVRQEKGPRPKVLESSATTVNSCWSRLSNTFCCCRYGPALWSRTGGHGWRHTHVNLTTHSLDRVRQTYMIQSCCWAEFVKLMITDVCVCVCAGAAEGRAEDWTKRTDRCWRCHFEKGAVSMTSNIDLQVTWFKGQMLLQSQHQDFCPVRGRGSYVGLWWSHSSSASV